jgi:hypothetical protein
MGSLPLPESPAPPKFLGESLGPFRSCPSRSCLTRRDFVGCSYRVPSAGWPVCPRYTVSAPRTQAQQLLPRIPCIPGSDHMPTFRWIFVCARNGKLMCGRPDEVTRLVGYQSAWPPKMSRPLKTFVAFDVALQSEPTPLCRSVTDNRRKEGRCKMSSVPTWHETDCQFGELKGVVLLVVISSS